MYLTPDELADLTDRHTRKGQIAWLDANGWVYAVSSLGNPKVLRSYAEQRGGIGQAATGDMEPDFSHWPRGAAA